MKLKQLLAASTAVALAGTGLVLAATAPASAVTTQTQVLDYTGGQQYFTVPAGVTSLEVLMFGGRGGDGSPASGVSQPGGLSAYVNFSAMPVTPGESLRIVVGGHGESGNGSNGGNGGFGGGGSGATTGQRSGGGGGMSAIFRGVADAVAVAAGGGGAGANVSNLVGGSGGRGGTPNGFAGSIPVNGNSGAGGGGHTNPDGSGNGGAGGVSPASSSYNGSSGSLLVGGSGGSIGGGGGGGGYFGGGGGSGSPGGPASGGGGGSSYSAIAGTTYGENPYPNVIDGRVMISWVVPDSTTGTVPAAKVTQVPTATCATIPGGGKIKRSTMKRLLKSGCTTNAGQRVAVKLDATSSVAKLVCQKPKKKAKGTKAISAYGAGYRYCSSGELKVATKTKRKTVRITWYAPATATHEAYSVVKSYKIK